MSYDALFSPIKLRGLELKNRVVLPGMNTKMVKDKHNVGEDLPAYHAARAAGGCGLNIVELVSICPECHAYLYLGLYNEHHRDELRKVTDAIHAAGGKAAVQIWHGGFVPEEFFDKTNKLETPDTLTVERIHEIVKQFGYSAKLAVEAGFDALEFHGAHTYLPHEFMNPSLNKRTDEYGNQSLENRCRFNLEVIREMRKNMPEDMPLLMRLDAIDEMLPAVTTQDETVQFINWAAEAGVDAIDLSRGNARSLATVYEVPPYNLEPGFNMDNIAAIKARVNIPVIGVGRIVDPALADQLIREGKIDMVAVGRAQLADPEWCNKSKEGREAEIRRCIGCTEGCYDKVIDPKAKHITCTRNPALCLEYKGLPKPETAKNVMVIGAGPAGLQAAEAAAKRGHDVTVYEAQDQLGGQFRSAAFPVGKGELSMYISSLRASLEELDVNVIATGAKPLTPPIPGIENAVFAEDVLLGKAIVNPGPVVVCGGGEVGAETADFIAQYRDDVTVLEMRGELCLDMMPITKGAFMEMMANSGVKSHVNATVKCIESGVEVDTDIASWSGEAGAGSQNATGFAVVYTDAQGIEHKLPAATVVSAFGYKAYNPLEEIARKHCDNVQVVGCAVKAGNAVVASREGYEAGLAI